MIIHGIQIMEGMADNPWKMAKIVALPVLKPFENAKIKISGAGFVPKTDSTGRADFPSIGLDYARKLVSTGAFVANKEYELVLGMDEETLEMIVTKLVPVDPNVKKHFDDCMGKA
jgi:hypothetical protein